MVVNRKKSNEFCYKNVFIYIKKPSVGEFFKKISVNSQSRLTHVGAEAHRRGSKRKQFLDFNMHNVMKAGT